jgi:SAM-dependent methyltransferase
MHSLENTEHISDLLQEIWRVLASNGRMIVMVPHRSGLWARESRTPFGFGFSFSMPHIKRILSHNRFQIERHERALYVPPFAQNFFAGSADWIERHANRWCPALAGVLLLEVSKQVYARPSREKVRMTKPVLMPLHQLVSPSPRHPHSIFSIKRIK